MMLAEYVIDADFFQKISSAVKYRNIDETLRFKHINGEIDHAGYDECRCFIELLKAVNSYKFKMGVNAKILKEYITFVKNCPPDIRQIFGTILEKQECFKNVTNRLDTRITDHFLKTLLESKLEYIIVASFLNPKIIVSTNDEINKKYELCCDKLWELQINWKCACTAKDEILYSR